MVCHDAMFSDADDSESSGAEEAKNNTVSPFFSSDITT